MLVENLCGIVGAKGGHLSTEAVGAKVGQHSTEAIGVEVLATSAGGYVSRGVGSGATLARGQRQVRWRC